MPPPESNLSLSETEIQLIKKWIEQGAKYEPHWAFVKAEKSELPEETDWTINEIDRFALKKSPKKAFSLILKLNRMN